MTNLNELNEQNPWINVTVETPYAECDKEIIFNKKYKDIVQVENTFPEPYSGNIKSNVVCLNGNPGMRDDQFINRELFYSEMKDTLNHSSKDFLWLSDKIKSTKHLGIGWWEGMTKSLQREVGFKPQLFVLEYFPYHSRKMFNFPQLPSDMYRNRLLIDAMDSGELIIIMRAKSRWESIKENGLGELLKKYPRKIVLHNPQRVFLSKNNMGEENWKLFLAALKSPLIK